MVGYSFDFDDEMKMLNGNEWELFLNTVIRKQGIVLWT